MKADGTVIHGVFAAKYDGRDYPVLGDPDSDTVSLKKIDANTVEFTFKKDAKAILNERAIVSVDGQTIRLIVKGMDSKGKSGEATLMYDRQFETTRWRRDGDSPFTIWSMFRCAYHSGGWPC